MSSLWCGLELCRATMGRLITPAISAPNATSSMRLSSIIFVFSGDTRLWKPTEPFRILARTTNITTDATSGWIAIDETNDISDSQVLKSSSLLNFALLVNHAYLLDSLRWIYPTKMIVCLQLCSLRREIIIFIEDYRILLQIILCLTVPESQNQSLRCEYRRASSHRYYSLPQMAHGRRRQTERHGQHIIRQIEETTLPIYDTLLPL